MVRSLLEAGAAAGSHERRDILNESEPAASSALSGERRTAISELAKLVTLFCSIYNVGLRNIGAVARDWRLRESERYGEPFLAYAPYNVRIVQEKDQAKYDVLDSNHMKDTAKVLADIMNPGAHEHVHCFVLQTPLWDKAFTLKIGRTSQYQGLFQRAQV